jgi:hypothetical protein
MSILAVNVQSAPYLVWSDKNQKYSAKTLPYSCNVSLGGSNIIKAEFCKLGKKSEVYFSVTIKADFTILLTFNLHKTANKFLEQPNTTPQRIGNETDIIWNHFAYGKLSYIQEHDQSILLVHSLRYKFARFYDGNVTNGMVKRVKDIPEEEILATWSTLSYDVEPIVSFKYYAKTRLNELFSSDDDDHGNAIDDPANVTEHQNLADNIQADSDPVKSVRTTDPDPEPLPELTSFDDDANKLPDPEPLPALDLKLQTKFATNPKVMVKRELMSLAASLGIPITKKLNNDSIIAMIDQVLSVTV